MLQTGQSAQTSVQIRQILSRLLLDKRGSLVALLVDGHYVEVATTKGKTLILMRPSDAIAECATRGLQFRRSDWVALGHIASLRSNGTAAVVVLNTGTALQIARPRWRALQRAGFLPFTKSAGGGWTGNT